MSRYLIGKGSGGYRWTWCEYRYFVLPFGRHFQSTFTTVTTMAPDLSEDRIRSYKTDELVRIAMTPDLAPEDRENVRNELDRRGGADKQIETYRRLNAKYAPESTDPDVVSERELKKKAENWRTVCIIGGSLTLLGAVGMTFVDEEFDPSNPLQLLLIGGLLLLIVIGLIGVITRNLIGPVLLILVHSFSLFSTLFLLDRPSGLLGAFFFLFADSKLLSLYLKVAKVEKQREMRERTRAIVDSPVVEAGSDIV